MKSIKLNYYVKIYKATYNSSVCSLVKYMGIFVQERQTIKCTT